MSGQDPMIGRVVLGRYRIVRPLAKGGMGVVYLARTEGASGFSKPFVVKRMATDMLVDPSMLRMFVREARLMSRLRHPGLVGVVDFGEQDGSYLMVLEYVHGFHLGQWFRYLRSRKTRFPVDRIVHVLAKVLDGLEYAHTLTDADGSPLNIVHRDVSPSNILIDVEGHVKLADFGVARSTDQTEHTEETTIKGKMPYLAPELFRLAKPSPATDVYACAVVLHEVLTGRNEFRTGDMATTVSRVLEHVPTRLDRARTDVPQMLTEILEKALHKDPSVRFQDAGSLARALRQLRGLPEQEADAALRHDAREDFLNAEMAQRLGVPSLTERDEAWRNPPPEVLESIEVHISSAPPTTVERPVDDGNQNSTSSAHSSIAPARRNLVWASVATLAALVVVASGIAIALYQSRPDSGNSGVFVVVQPNQPDSGSTGPNTPQVATSGTDAGRIASMTSMRVSPPPRRSTAQQLSRVFGRRQAQVLACFESPSSQLELNVRFEVGRNGRVTNATLTPASAAQTASGRCILRVARGTRFPPQPQPIAFSIPIAVNSRPR